MTSGITTAYILDPSDASVLTDVDVSTLSSGDVVTFDYSLDSNNNYSFTADAGGSSFTAGYLNEAPLPINSSDGQISMVDGWLDGSGGSANAWVFDKIGNINLG